MQNRYNNDSISIIGYTAACQQSICKRRAGRTMNFMPSQILEPLAATLPQPSNSLCFIFAIRLQHDNNDKKQ